MKKILHSTYKRLEKIAQSHVLKKRLRKTATLNPIKNARELTILMNERAYLHDDEVPVLAKYASKAQDTIVEIGSAFGGSPALLLVNKQDGATVHSIDPFITDSMADFQATEEKCRENVRLVLTATRQLPAMHAWVLHRDYSYNVIKTWDTPIDMLFIDGDHTYDAVKRDFTEWFPKVRVGGVILFHDSRKEEGTSPETFNRGWSGPTTFVRELKNNSSVLLVEEAFSLTVWEKIHD